MSFNPITDNGVTTINKLTSKYKGVSFYKPTKKWVAKITIDGIQKSLGYFKEEIKASEAYQEALKNRSMTAFNPMMDTNYRLSEKEQNTIRMRNKADSMISKTLKDKTIKGLETHYVYEEKIELINDLPLKIHRFNPSINSDYLPIVSSNTFYDASKMALNAMHRYESMEGTTIKDFKNQKLK